LVSEIQTESSCTPGDFGRYWRVFHWIFLRRTKRKMQSARGSEGNRNRKQKDDQDGVVSNYRNVHLHYRVTHEIWANFLNCYIYTSKAGRLPPIPPHRKVSSCIVYLEPTLFWRDYPKFQWLHCTTKQFCTDSKWGIGRNWKTKHEMRRWARKQDLIELRYVEFY
jgi:hypothetical protein